MATGGDAVTDPPVRPPVTIVLATHARPAFLGDCVASIARAMRDDDELLVVECCNPDAAALLEDVRAAVHVADAHAPKCSKLNAALRRASHDVVLVTDDDCRVPPDWVDAMVRPFVNPAVGVAFGPVVGLSATPGDGLRASVPPGPAPVELWNYAHGASMAVRASAVRDAGGFDERLGAGTSAGGGEEGDLVLRLARRGWACEVAGGTPVDHLEWRDDTATVENLVAYQRGGGAYLGSALRRDTRTALKPFVLRVLHERGHWRDRRTRGGSFGARLSLAFLGGVARGVALPPRRYLEPAAPAPRPAGRPRVLWVTDEPPDRAKGGGNIRQAMLLDALHAHIDVTLLLAGALDDARTRERLTAVYEVPAPAPRRPVDGVRRRARDLWRVLVRRQPVDVTDARRACRALRRVLERIADDFDVVVVQHLTLAPLLPKRRTARWIVEVHNLPSERARQELAQEPGRRQRWLLAREAANARHYQQRVITTYDAVVVVSDDDAAVLEDDTLHAHAPITVVPNGVDTTTIATTPLPVEPHVLLPATLNYRPNVLGAQWFCAEVLPRVREKVPDVRFALVGRDPVPEVRALAREPNVELHADVPAMAPWLAWARAVVVPLHVGTGTRLKALEAMAAGRPLVGTAIGLEGLAIVDGVHARVVDDATAMADDIVELLSSDATANTLASTARQHVEAHYRWDAIARTFAHTVEQMAGTRA